MGDFVNVLTLSEKPVVIVCSLDVVKILGAKCSDDCGDEVHLMVATAAGGVWHIPLDVEALRR